MRYDKNKNLASLFISKIRAVKIDCSFYLSKPILCNISPSSPQLLTYKHNYAIILLNLKKQKYENENDHFGSNFYWNIFFP